MKQTAMAMAVVAAALALAACSPFKITVKETPGVKMPGRYKFRMNYVVHDDKGRNITDEIMEKHLEKWLLFTELSGAVRASLEDRGYVGIDSPTEPVDFIVDVCFSAFYSNKVKEEDMVKMPSATLLAGASHTNSTYTHMVVVTAAARAPQTTSNKMVTLWEARGIATDKNADLRLCAFPMVANMIAKFPDAKPR